MPPPLENDEAPRASGPRQIFYQLPRKSAVSRAPAQVLTQPGVGLTAAQLCATWTTEARRLAGLFAATGNWKHFFALVRHVAGMCWRLNSSPEVPAPSGQFIRRI